MTQKRLKKRYCIIGAGPCGLAACRQLQRLDLSFDCFERQDNTGGNWYFGGSHSSIFESTHLISSKRLTEFSELRMPREFPQYPSHQQALQYLRDYSAHFDLAKHITFNQEVSRICKSKTQRWSVETADGTRREYDGVIVANGHHWDPVWPQWKSDFDGEILHARDYTSPDLIAGKRVLVVGAGNSGCDIAVECARHASSTLISLRRGYHFLPKFLFGAPIDRCGENLRKWGLPKWLNRWIAGALLRVAVGSPTRYGLPSPDHKLFETHPIVNSEITFSVGHGKIQPKPDIQSVRKDVVTFSDGSAEQVDMIICATGYGITFPFLAPSLASIDELYLNAFHPSHRNLFFSGLLQPDGGIWALAELQCRLIALWLYAQETESEANDWLQRRISPDRGWKKGFPSYVDSPRHRIQVDYFDYRSRLRKLIAEMETLLGNQLEVANSAP